MPARLTISRDSYVEPRNVLLGGNGGGAGAYRNLNRAGPQSRLRSGRARQPPYRFWSCPGGTPRRDADARRSPDPTCARSMACVEASPARRRGPASPTLRSRRSGIQGPCRPQIMKRRGGRSSRPSARRLVPRRGKAPHSSVTARSPGRGRVVCHAGVARAGSAAARAGMSGPRTADRSAAEGPGGDISAQKGPDVDGTAGEASAVDQERAARTELAAESRGVRPRSRRPSPDDDRRRRRRAARRAARRRPRGAPRRRVPCPRARCRCAGRSRRRSSLSR